MASNPTETLVPARVEVSLAAVGTAVAAGLAALSGSWHNVGNTTTDGLNFNTSPTFDTLTSAQSDFPIRTFQTADAATVSVVLEDWSAKNLIAAYGGGEITEPSSGLFKFVPPSFGGHEETACVIDITDGDLRFRYVFPRMMQTDGVQTALGKGAGATLPLSLAVQGADGVDPWYLITNSDSFDLSDS